MKSKVTKKVLLGLLALAFSGTVATTDVSAQTMTNTTSGAKYHATCGAVLRMNKADGTIVGQNGNTIGQSTDPIPGIVQWTAANVTVPAYYYSRLYVTGTPSTMTTGINIIGGVCSTANSVVNIAAGEPNLTNYPYINKGTPTYGTEFTYSPSTGNSTAENTVNIWPASQTNPYQDLAVTTGVGVIPATTTTYADHVTTTVPAGGSTTLQLTGNLITGAGTSDVASALQIDGTGELTTGTGNVTVKGETTVADNGKITVPTGGTGDVTFTGNVNLNGDLAVADGSVGTPNGPVALNGTTAIGTSGTVNIGSNDELAIGGSITNAGDGTNLTFACSSIEHYTSTTAGQVVLSTITAKPYGNLVLTGAAKVNGTTTSYAADKNNINVCSGFSLADGNLTMSDDTYSGALIMQNDDGNTQGTVAYTNGTVTPEVVGKMTQNPVATAQTYTYNNSSTTVGLPANNAGPTSFTIDVRPTTNPLNYDNTKDVNRKITISYPTTTSTFAYSLKVGYLPSEATGWATGNTEAQLRYYENVQGITPQKIATGQTYAKDATATPFHTISLGGINKATETLAAAGNSNTIDQFFSGNDVLLRAGATQFYSIRNGRWSNPGTWDEGTTPTVNDDVFIRTQVFAGIDADGTFVGATNSGGADEAANNQKPEYDLYGASDYAANNVTIINQESDPLKLTDAHPALIIGNEDNNADWTLKFKGVLTNSNIDEPGTGIQWDNAGFQHAKNTVLGTGNTAFNGIWLISGTTFSTANTKVPGLSAKDIQNAGTNNNEGLEEVRGE